MTAAASHPEPIRSRKAQLTIGEPAPSTVFFLAAQIISVANGYSGLFGLLKESQHTTEGGPSLLNLVDSPE
jgi:hypothetical protein